MYSVPIILCAVMTRSIFMTVFLSTTEAFRTMCKLYRRNFRSREYHNHESPNSHHGFHPQVIFELRAAKSLVLCIVFCRSLFVVLVFGLHFIDLRILVIPLVSSNLFFDSYIYSM
jgi:hypothetical protein